jgi:hypothetical protein
MLILRAEVTPTNLPVVFSRLYTIDGVDMKARSVALREGANHEEVGV